MKEDGLFAIDVSTASTAIDKAQVVADIDNAIRGYRNVGSNELPSGGRE